MSTINEPDYSGISKIDKINLLSRKRKRIERIDEQKEDNHWAFLAGTLVAKYLKKGLEHSGLQGERCQC